MLERNRIEAVADVRSSPYSRWVPQFNKEDLETQLKAGGISYVFLGDNLGARPKDPECYRDGQVRFDILAHRPFFLEGLDRIRQGASKYRLALLCAEKDPITCHRMILVCRHLRSGDTEIGHIREDGTVEPNEEAEDRLLTSLKMPTVDLFRDHKQLVEEAYDHQGEVIAYREDE
jgi:uncharacterized protein (DUF488 family)